jgi:plasmid stability protein
MGSLSIRKLDDEIIHHLRVQAAKHNISMEEEARRILRQAVTPHVRLGDLAQQLFGEENGVELQLPESQPHEPLSFTE